MKMMVTKDDLIDIGFKEHQAKVIIQRAKKELVNDGYPLYNGTRIGCVPKSYVEKIIGVSLDDKGEQNE
uniref:DUF3173 family protein n=1 Tax=Anaerococcus mediterraneensis TaxID=1870984 RepID=UPI00092FE3D0|nr:DUF3173 family protein [Anaerococcus mediterraneensis]